MTGARPSNPERSFGVGVGGVLCVLAIVLWWRGQGTRAEAAGAVGALLVVSGLWVPGILRWPSALWWGFARALGFVMTRVWLTLLFMVILVPAGLLWRITGKDPLGR